MKSGSKSLALFKARLTAEASGKNLDDSWVTNVFYVAIELKKLPEEIGQMSAFSFQVFIEEMSKKAEREKAETNKTKKFR